MNIGEMNRQIQWKMPISNRNETGESWIEWVESNAVWAKVDFQDGDEKGKEGRDTDITTVIFSTYYNDGIDNTYRVVYGSDEYEILSIQTGDNKMFMDVLAKRYETA